MRWEARGVIGVIAAIVTFVAIFTPQAATYLVLNGHLGPHSSVGRKMNWMAPHALQVLFSPEHGFFVWTPLALIAILGLVAAAIGPVASAFRQKDHVWLCLLLMVVLQIYVGGSVESWTVAGAYGQRRFIALTAVMVIGLTALQHGLKNLAAQRALMTVVALAVYWNFALIAEFSIGLMDRQRLEPRKNAYDAFVTLPRQAPSLIYRYLFDRPSFYRGAKPDAGGA